MSDMITIPRTEYDRLVEIAEDAADARAVEEFKAKLARGEEEMLPSEFVDRLLDGENPIRLWREHRGMSLNELALKADMHRTALSRVEHGHRGVRVETLKGIADALSVTMDDLA